MADFPIYCHIRYDAVMNEAGKMHLTCTDVSDHDFVEVVRCRDCKHYHNPNSSEQLFCYWVEPNEDDFCSCGERREQNDPNPSDPSEVP